MEKVFVYFQSEWMPIRNTSYSSKLYFRDNEDNLNIAEIMVRISLSDLVELGLINLHGEGQPTKDDTQTNVMNAMLNVLKNYFETERKFPPGNELVLNSNMIRHSNAKRESLRDRFSITVDI